MKYFRILTCCLLVSACTGAPPPPRPPSDPGVIVGDVTGLKVAQVQRYCTAVADQSCPGFTIRCTAYQRAYVPNCMSIRGVPPEYIIALQR